MSAALENSIPFKVSCARDVATRGKGKTPSYLSKLPFVEEGRQGYRLQQGVLVEDNEEAQELDLILPLAV